MANDYQQIILHISKHFKIRLKENDFKCASV